MTLLVLLYLSICPAITLAGSSSLRATVDSGTASFYISVAGSPWLRGVPPTARWGGGASSGYRTSRALRLVKHVHRANLTHPTLGGYDEDRFFWEDTQNTSSLTEVETAFKVFADGEPVSISGITNNWGHPKTIQFASSTKVLAIQGHEHDSTTGSRTCAVSGNFVL